MSDTLYQRVFESLPLTAALLDVEGNVVAVNAEWRCFASDNGAASETHLGVNYIAVCRQADQPDVKKLATGLESLLAGECDIFEMEYPCHSPEARRWFSMRATPIATDTGRYLLVCHLDITDRKLAEEEAWRQATRDELTGMLRRGSFEERLQQSLDRAARRRERVAVFFLDLDNFKELNDGFGHAAGDAYLESLGERLRERLRRADSVARWGGDEIVFFAEDADAAVQQRIRERLDEVFAEPVEFRGQTLRGGASVGVAVYPDDGQSPDAVIRAADRDMYRQKQSARETQ